MRREEFDILKGLGIVLMIMGHIDYGDQFDTFIHSFHMPLFFLVSGFFMKESTVAFHVFLKSKIKALIIPYVLFSSFHFLLKLPLLIRNGGLNDALLAAIFNINTNNFPIAGALWFLPALFNTFILFYFIQKIDNNYLRHLIVLLLSITGCYLHRFIVLPWSIDISLAMLFLFNLSFSTKNFITKSKSIHSLCAILFIIGLYLVLSNGHVNVREREYSNVVLFYANAVIMTLTFYWISCVLAPIHNIITKEISFIGKNSIIYMSFNQLLVWGPNLYILKNYTIEGFTLKTATLLVSLIILHLLSNRFMKSEKWLYLIGKRK